jgi:hypothetical protein
MQMSKTANWSDAELARQHTAKLTAADYTARRARAYEFWTHKLAESNWDDTTTFVASRAADAAWYNTIAKDYAAAAEAAWHAAEDAAADCGGGAG